MRFRRLVPVVAAFVTLATTAWAQDSAQAVAQQAELRAMVEHIARERPPQAEYAARELLRRVQMDPAVLDSLRQRSLAEYWAEVAQLTVRQQLMAQMFGAEARARSLQRDYRRMIDTIGGQGQPVLVVDGVPVNETANRERLRVLRQQLQVILERHLAAEDSLRSLEIADVERRLAQVRAETARRRRDRAALIQEMVEQVLRDAKPPE